MDDTKDRVFHPCVTLYQDNSHGQKVQLTSALFRTMSIFKNKSQSELIQPVVDLFLIILFPVPLLLPALTPREASLPSHQGLKSMVMFSLHVQVVGASPFREEVVTLSPYRPMTAVAGELTDSFILLPVSSTTFASQRSSSRCSTSGMMMWVPLETMGSGPTPDKRDVSLCA